MESAFIDLEGGEDVTAIKWPGAMQWFHVKKGEAGTYSIGRTNPMWSSMSLRRMI